MAKYLTPSHEGFWWGKLTNPTGRDSRSGEPLEASHEYEVIHVVDNNGEGDEKWMVMVPGASDWEPLDSFVWGPEVLVPEQLTRRR